VRLPRHDLPTGWSRVVAWPEVAAGLVLSFVVILAIAYAHAAAQRPARRVSIGLATPAVSGAVTAPAPPPGAR